MKKPNILIICPFFRPNIGGVETHLDKLTQYLSLNSFKTTVLTYKPLSIKSQYLKVEKENNLTIHRFWNYGIGIFDKTTPFPLLQFLYIVPSLLINSLLYSLAHKKDFDIIHAHGFAAAFIARIIKLFLPTKKVIVSTHFIYHRLNNKSVFTKLFSWVFLKVDNILAVSLQSKKELISVGIDSSKIDIFRYWIDQNKFKPFSKVKTRLDLNIDKKYTFIIFFAGRYVKMKGIFTLLKVAKLCPANFLFIFAGNGPEAKNFDNLAKSQINVLNLGQLPHQDIIKYISLSDIIAVPSLTEEAQPNIVIESLSCGRPVITGNRGSVGEMFDNSVGISLKPTVNNLYQKLLFLSKNKAILDKMTLNSKPFAINHFGNGNIKVIINSYQ